MGVMEPPANGYYGLEHGVYCFPLLLPLQSAWRCAPIRAMKSNTKEGKGINSIRRGELLTFRSPKCLKRNE